MTKILSNYMRNAILNDDINAVKRFLWLHKGNRGAINAHSYTAVTRYSFNLGNPRGQIQHCFIAGGLH